MKKTVLLLLAAAGMAMGATPEPLSITWAESGKEAVLSGFTFENEAVSVALTLNWAEVRKLTDDTYFFILDDEANDYTSNAIHGMGIDIASEGKGYVGSWLSTINQPEGAYLSSGIDMMLSSNWQSATYATLVYTSKIDGTNYTMNAYIHLWDANGNIMPTDGDPPENKSRTIPGFNKITSILINSNLVSDINVYNSVLDYNQVIEVSTGLKDIAMQSGSSDNNSPTIPEPTTATLSLLALAGLAARRRRR